MPTPSDITGLVLAGGQSRRFGRDKALATHDGRPFIQIAHDALAPHCMDVLIATGPTLRDYPVSVRSVPDPTPDGGPLAGLAAGLAESKTTWLLAVAVDLPHLTPDALAPLLASATDADAVVAVDAEGRRQPVCALWRCATVRPIVEARLARRQLALFGLLDELVVQEVALAPGVLRNVNRASDLG
ncbi:MAG: hypothetical protein Rubg2KO_25730 [Rubricoccaceae bacterium]